MFGPSTQAIHMSAADQTVNALYKVHFFGPFRVTCRDQPVGEPVWRRTKAKALLKWFLLNSGRKFAADQLVKAFWPDMNKASAERNFHVAIHYLRHLLEPDLPPRHESTYIRRDKNNLYWFEIDDNWWADVFDIHHCHVEAKDAEQRGEHAEAIARYNQIVELCSKGFLHEDAYEDIFASYRRHYERIYTEVLEHLMHLYIQKDMSNEALTFAHQALLVDPYCETAVKAIAHAYFRQGNAAGAIRQLDYFQEFFKSDMGMEPSEDIVSLRKMMAGF